MTPQELTIYRLRLRVALLERFCYSVSIGLLMKAGANLDQAKSVLRSSISDAESEMRAGLPTYPDPAQQAQAHDEFDETVADLKKLIDSYR